MQKSFLRRTACLFPMAIAFALLTAVTAGASDYETVYGKPFRLRTDDFLPAYTDTISGIYVSQVPASTDGAFVCAGRVLHAGDVLSADVLDQVELTAARDRDAVLTLGYYPIVNRKLSAASEIVVQVNESKNDPPTAQDSTFETYKNIPNDGQLIAADPENDTLTYTLTSEPKRGTVEISDDGTFVYTPKQNKVGKDKFSFTVTDAAGNTSNEATVSVKILKPTDAATYSDMQNDPDQFEALWLRNSGLLGGKSVGGNACFDPNQAVSRGEFLVMVMNLADIAPDDSLLCSGFCDEDAAPVWVRPYLASAMRSGIVSGIRSDGGLLFAADQPVTYAQAAVMLQNLLSLPEPDTLTVFADEIAIPVWAVDSVPTLNANGFDLKATDYNSELTRRDAAQLLYRVSLTLS